MTVQYGKSIASNPDYFDRPSPSIWGNFPSEAIRSGRATGFYKYERFDMPPFITTATTTEAALGNGWQGFASTSTNDILLAGLEGGGGIALFETDDNEGCSISTINCPFKLDLGKGDAAVEFRFKASLVTDTKAGIFAGLVDTAANTVITPMAADGTLDAAGRNYIGWHRLEGDGDQLDCVHAANGGTQVNTKTDAISTTALVHTVAGSLAADTFIKAGFKFKKKDGRVYWYLNGIELPDYTTVPTADGTTFPNDVQLGVYFGQLNATAADDHTSTLAWVCFGQEGSGSAA